MKELSEMFKLWWENSKDEERCNLIHFKATELKVLSRHAWKAADIMGKATSNLDQRMARVAAARKAMDQYMLCVTELKYMVSTLKDEIEPSDMDEE